MVSYIFVIHQLHELEFPVRPLGVSNILKGAAQLFDGHILLRYTVICSTKILKNIKMNGNFFKNISHCSYQTMP